MKKLIAPSFLGFAVLLSSCSEPGGADKVAEVDYSRVGSKTAANEFVFNNGAEPETLDPHRMQAHDAAFLANQLHEGLLSRAPDYVTLKPGLAESWEISEDGKTYTFKFREGLKWSNGDPITMEQIRDSIFRSMEPDTANPYGYWLTEYIEGAQEYYDGFSTPKKEELKKKVGVKTSGRTLTITIKKPVSYFKYFLSQPPYMIVHPSMRGTDADAWKRPGKFISSSAYKLSRWEVNQVIEMEKNPNYWDADSVSIEKVKIFPIEQGLTPLNMYRQGELDWTGDNMISSSAVATLKKRNDFYLDRILGTYMYSFNVKRKPFGDVRVRKALALAVDNRHITDRVIRTGILPTNALVPPVLPGYDTPKFGSEDFSERVEQAKKLLAEAGYPDGKGFPEVTVRYNTSEGHHKVAQAVQQMWKKYLGIDVGIENMEWKVFLKEQQSHNFDISRKGWIGDYPDPATFLEIYTTGNDNNETQWSNKEYDALVKKAVTIIDDEERYKVYKQAEEIWMNEQPGFSIYNYVYYGLMNPEIEGFQPNLTGHYYIRDLEKNR